MTRQFLFIRLLVLAVVICGRAVFAADVDAKQFLKQLDQHQYHLETAGAKSFTARYYMTADGIMEAGDKVTFDVTWSSDSGFALKVKSDDWDTFHPDDIRHETRDFLDDVILGRRYSEMFKDMKVTVARNGKEYFVHASNKDLNPSDVQLWIDKKMRVYKATIVSKDIPEAVFEFKYDETERGSRVWLVDTIKIVKIRTRDEGNIARAMQEMEIEYLTTQTDSGKKVYILLQASLTGVLYELMEDGENDPEDEGEDIELLLTLDSNSFEVK